MQRFHHADHPFLVVCKYFVWRPKLFKLEPQMPQIWGNIPICQSFGNVSLYVRQRQFDHVVSQLLNSHGASREIEERQMLQQEGSWGERQRVIFVRRSLGP